MIKIEQPLKIGKVELVPSLNTLINEHFHTKKARKNLLTAIVMASNLKPVKGAYFVSYIRYYSKVPLDELDNFGASLKNLMDVLQELNLIEGDSPKFITHDRFKAHQIKVKTKAEEKFCLSIWACDV